MNPCLVVSLAPMVFAAALIGLALYRVGRRDRAEKQDRAEKSDIPIYVAIVLLIAMAIFNNVAFEGGGLKLNVSGRLCGASPESDACADRRNMAVLIVSTDARAADRSALDTFLRQRGIDSDTLGSDLSEFDHRDPGTNRVIFDRCGEPFVRSGNLYQILNDSRSKPTFDTGARQRVLKNRSIQILMY